MGSGYYDSELWNEKLGWKYVIRWQIKGFAPHRKRTMNTEQILVIIILTIIPISHIWWRNCDIFISTPVQQNMSSPVLSKYIWKCCRNICFSINHHCWLTVAVCSVSRSLVLWTSFTIPDVRALSDVSGAAVSSQSRLSLAISNHTTLHQSN